MKKLYLIAIWFVGAYLAGCGSELPPPPPMPTLEDIPKTRKHTKPSLCDSLNSSRDKVESLSKKLNIEKHKAQEQLDRCFEQYGSKQLEIGVCDQWERKLIELKKQHEELVLKRKFLENELLYRCD